MGLKHPRPICFAVAVNIKFSHALPCCTPGVSISSSRFAHSSRIKIKCKRRKPFASRYTYAFACCTLLLKFYIFKKKKKTNTNFLTSPNSRRKQRGGKQKGREREREIRGLKLNSDDSDEVWAVPESDDIFDHRRSGMLGGRSGVGSGGGGGGVRWRGFW